MTHIYPINDLREHDMASTCFCNPIVKDAGEGELMCVHNSFDGREGLELANEVLEGIDRDSSKYKENDVVYFIDNDIKVSAIVISVQFNPVKYFVEGANGRFWQIDESDLL